MRAVLSLIATVLVLTAGLAAAQPGQPMAPAPAPAATTLPDWVAKYAGLQEQAARACQIQLSQEQTKVDELTKQLADAQKAAAANTSAPKK